MKNRINFVDEKGWQTRWNLDNPSHCRDFLKALRFGDPKTEGSKITMLRQADGKEVSIDEASDEAILNLVREIAQVMEKPNGPPA